jgi:hypothetical protein
MIDSRYHFKNKAYSFWVLGKFNQLLNDISINAYKNKIYSALIIHYD